MNCDASTISRIDMDIFVDNSGSAIVTEKWQADVTEGTEGWHPYYHLGMSEISNVKVKMDGKEFTTVDSWNEDSSFSDKAFKAGLYYPSNEEVDVVFGISEYGFHKYEIQYKIDNFVSTTSDADMIYWNLFPYDFSAEPDNVTIRIYSDFKYDDKWDVYVFGKAGKDNNYIYDGEFGLEFAEPVKKDEYITVLFKFPKGTFHTSSVLDNEYQYYYDMAMDGAVNYNDNKSIWDKIGEFFAIMMSIIFAIIPVIVIIIAALFSSSKNNNIKFGNAGNKVKKDVLPFREIPCKKDIFRAYWVATNYHLTKKKEDFLGSVILGWLKNGNVTIEKVTKKGLFKENIESNIIFGERPDSNEFEQKLYILY